MKATPSLWALAGGQKGSQVYILFPDTDKLHSINVSLDSETRILLGRQDVGNPVKTLLQEHYALLKIINTGTHLPFFSAIYQIHISINVTTIQQDKLAFKNIVAFMRMIDKLASNTDLPYYLKVFNFADGAERPVVKLHGYGARALELHMSHFTSLNEKGNVS